MIIYKYTDEDMTIYINIESIINKQKVIDMSKEDPGIMTTVRNLTGGSYTIDLERQIIDELLNAASHGNHGYSWHHLLIENITQLITEIWLS